MISDINFTYRRFKILKVQCLGNTPLFIRYNVRNETDESDPTTTPELMLVRSLELLSGLRKSTVSYTPSGSTLQLGIFSAPRFPPVIRSMQSVIRSRGAR